MFTNFTYESTANKIRTKLLLFIDEEIQFKIKQKKLYYNPQNEEKNITLYSDTDKNYSHQENTFFISFSKFKEKIAKNDIKLKTNRQKPQQSISTRLASLITKDKLFQNEDLKNIPVYLESSIGKKNFHTHFLPFNNIINIKDNFYLIKKESKPSSTFQIYKKPKTDKQYLRNLCNSFKIIKKNDLFCNKQTKFKLISVAGHNNREKSSPIKKAKRNNSGRIKTNINNLL